MSGNSPVLTAWDTGVFLAWITGEKRSADEDAGLRHYVELFAAGKLTIVSSVLVLTEMLECKLNGEQLTKFRTLFQRKDCVPVAVSRPVAEIAAEIRNYTALKGDNLPTLPVPDAIHIATAAVTKAKCLFTFDEQDKPGIQRSLLSLDGYVSTRYQVRILKPPPPEQGVLDLL